MNDIAKLFESISRLRLRESEHSELLAQTNIKPNQGATLPNQLNETSLNKKEEKRLSNASSKRILSLVHNIRADAQDLTRIIADIKKNYEIVDKTERQKRLKSSINEALDIFESDQTKIDGYLKSIDELIKKFSECYDLYCDTIEQIKALWSRITNNWPKSPDQDEIAIQQQANRVAQDLNEMISACDNKHKQTPHDIRVALRVGVYTTAIFSVAIYLLTNIWTVASKDLAVNVTSTGTFYGIGLDFSLDSEIALILVMMLSGIIGACVFSLFAISHHVGAHKDFDAAWEAWYLLRPFIGAGLALIFYFLLRGGVLTIGADLKSLNLTGVAGISGIVGMFAEHAMHKLQDLADTLFGPAPDDKSKQNASKASSTDMTKKEAT